jgi:hypothetical protein
MSKFLLAAGAALAFGVVWVPVAHAEDVSTKKIFIKDHAITTRRQIHVQSADAAVQFSEADDPATKGASLLVYSATDAFCVTLPAGANWTNTGSLWKYKDTVKKHIARIGNGKLLVKVKAKVDAINYSLADDGMQGTVNAQVQFGDAGVRYCLRCDGNIKDDAGKFLGKNCAAAACDPEPLGCTPNPTTTTTSTSSSTSTSSTSSTSTSTSSTTSTTCPPSTFQILKGSLQPTLGRFNYNLTLGLPGADAACNTNFPGTHACTYGELQAAAAACDLIGLQDVNGATVTSFWAIDPAAPALRQCVDDAPGGSNLNWEYGTAHTPSRGQRVTLNNATGALGALQSPVQCNTAGTNWVGCCL